MATRKAQKPEWEMGLEPQHTPGRPYRRPPEALPGGGWESKETEGTPQLWAPTGSPADGRQL